MYRHKNTAIQRNNNENFKKILTFNFNRFDLRKR